MSHKPSLKQLHQAQVQKQRDLIKQRDQLEMELMQDMYSFRIAARNCDDVQTEIFSTTIESKMRRLAIVNEIILECIV